MQRIADVEGAKPPFRKIKWLARDIEADRRPDGSVIVRSRIPLDPYETSIPARLARHAAESPDKAWLAQRRGPERQWRKITYAEAKRTIDSLTQALLNLRLEEGRPLAVLSGNSLEHALMAFAGMQARIPVAPMSAAYSLLSQDHEKLKAIFALIRPGVVFVQDGIAFEKALAALDLKGAPIVCVDRPPSSLASLAFNALAATPPTPAVEASIAKITGDTVGKLLFTSGSTGMPKAVVNTQRMMCANVAMGQQFRPRAPDDPRGVLLDWMPWSHSMGGNAIFHNASNGRTTAILASGSGWIKRRGSSPEKGTPPRQAGKVSMQMSNPTFTEI